MTYYISTTGNDSNNGSQTSPWKTLAKATSTVSGSGDIIHIMAGTYTETAKSNLKTGVSIEGDGKDTTIIKSSVTGTWNEFLSLSSGQNTNGNQSISGITLNGQAPTSGSSGGTWVGIWISGRSNINVHDCKFMNFYASGCIFDGFDATSPNSDPGVSATGNKFLNNEMTNCSGVLPENGYNGTGSVMMGGQTGLVIDGNNINNTARPALKNGWPIKYWDNGYLKGVKIINNVLVKAPYMATYWGQGGDWDFAIELFNIQGLEIGGNTIQGAIDLNYNYKGNYQYSVWIHDNVLDHVIPNYSHPESGIILEFATQSAIIENNSFNNCFVGVSFNSRTPGNHGGYTYPCPSGGCSENSNNIIRNNLFTNLYSGYGISGGVIIQSEGGSNDSYIDNMEISNNTFVAKSTQSSPLGIDFTNQNNGTTKNVTIKNNIFQGFSLGSIRANTAKTQSNNTVINNDYYQTAVPSWSGSGVTITNNISSNPNFNSSFVSPLYSSNNMGWSGANTPPPVNQPPTANAGTDKTLILPTNSVTLFGSGTDGDGSIVDFAWSKVSGPSSTINSPSSASTLISNLVEGTYVFRLTVTDDLNATGSDDVSVVVNPIIPPPNTPPVANAGPDKIITLPVNDVTLNGSGTDSDGSVVSFLWEKVSGPVGGTIISPTAPSTVINNLTQGIHIFRLTVTDNNGATGADTVQVTVNQAIGNIPPIADAGSDIVLTLPVNSTTLNGSGSDSDGTIVAYQWQNSNGGILSNTASTLLTNLVVGVYNYTLKVTDNNGATATDIVQVTVQNPLPPPNLPPVVNAGVDETFIISKMISGSATDDGTIASYAWTKVSGPTGLSIVSPTQPSTLLTGLKVGVYVLRLTVKDNTGLISFDDKTLTITY